MKSRNILRFGAGIAPFIVWFSLFGFFLAFGIYANVNGFDISSLIVIGILPAVLLFAVWPGLNTEKLQLNTATRKWRFKKARLFSTWIEGSFDEFSHVAYWELKDWADNSPTGRYPVELAWNNGTTFELGHKRNLDVAHELARKTAHALDVELIDDGAIHSSRIDPRATF